MDEKDLLENWPLTFDFTEQDLDTHFIGQIMIHHVDDYGTIKAGSISRSAVVRSRVDLSKGVIKLIANIPDRYGVSFISMDGSTGLYGEISERARVSDREIARVDFLFIKLLCSKTISHGDRMTIDKTYQVWKTFAEMDDIVFNQNKKYSYPIYFFASKKPASRLIGIYMEIPIEDFNHYVYMRDLWFRDYRGTRKIPKCVLPTKPPPNPSKRKRGGQNEYAKTVDGNSGTKVST